MTGVKPEQLPISRPRQKDSAGRRDRDFSMSFFAKIRCSIPQGSFK
jgi:hypothetical protein